MSAWLCTHLTLHTESELIVHLYEVSQGPLHLDAAQTESAGSEATLLTDLFIRLLHDCAIRIDLFWPIGFFVRHANLKIEIGDWELSRGSAT